MRRYRLPPPSPRPLTADERRALRAAPSGPSYQECLGDLVDKEDPIEHARGQCTEMGFHACWDYGHMDIYMRKVLLLYGNGSCDSLMGPL